MMSAEKEIIRANPYDYMRPVTSPTLFAGRREEMEIIREEISKMKALGTTSPMVVLSGERRVGKTSILLRIEEFCRGEKILSSRLNMTASISASPLGFWQEVFNIVLRSLRGAGIDLAGEDAGKIGFKTGHGTESANGSMLQLAELFAYFLSPNIVISPSVLKEAFEVIGNSVLKEGFIGLMLIVDEAHLLVDSDEIQRQLRYAVAEVKGWGVIFAGEPLIGQMFNNESKPFYHQARVIQIKNFRGIDEVAQCAIQPLAKEERMLMSPMTVDYLARLSQGKPNQIRLICSSIYSNYQKNQQQDLNISMGTLRDVLEIISSTYTEYDLKKLVEKIQILSSVDLEILYRITRYPDWEIDKIIDLDESFRAEGRSELAEKRRRRVLLEKRDKFIKEGLLKDIDNRCVLAGDEFLYLYVRFWYEIRKYGDLSRRLQLGKGPVTPFIEKVDKLVKSLTYEMRRYPRIRIFTHIHHNVETSEVREKVRQRFEVLESITSGKNLREMGFTKEALADAIGQCAHVCELVKESGPHHFVSVLVRNAQNVDELLHVELYFDPAGIITMILGETEKLLKKQAEMAQVWIEDINDFRIAYLPTLCDFITALGGPALEEMLEDLDDVSSWRIGSVQHFVRNQKPAKDKSGKEKPEKEEEEEEGEEDWLQRYDSGDERGAVKILDQRISKYSDSRDNLKLARYYNDRGYIKSTPKLNLVDEGEKDLQKAIAYHHYYLELTLSNLAVIYIDRGDYPNAIENIEDVLFLAVARENINAGYLKLRLPTHPAAPLGKMEQHPANIIEASYINLSYSLLSSNRSSQALQTLDEGLAVLPSSYRLKHAKARLLLSTKQAVLV